MLFTELYDRVIHDNITKTTILNEITLNEIDWENEFEDVKQTCMNTAQVVDYLNRVRANATKDTANREKFAAKYPFVHAKSSFFKDTEEGIDINHFIEKITTPPKNVINTNDKMLKSGDNNQYVYKTGIPAFRGIAYDITTEKFHFINTCPGAGSCVTICYALRGRYIQYPASYDSMTRRLNYLLNYPDKYETQLYNELKEKCKLHSAIKGYKAQVVLRWNDSGDFFAKRYTKMAENVMEKLQGEGYNVVAYAYTKNADVANTSNLDTTFSQGANKQQSEKIKADHKQSLVVPTQLFKDLNLLKYSDEAILKQRISTFFNIPKDLIISYDELKSMDNKGEQKWAVIVTPNDGDDAAFRSDVKTVLLTQH